MSDAHLMVKEEGDRRSSSARFHTQFNKDLPQTYSVRIYSVRMCVII